MEEITKQDEQLENIAFKAVANYLNTNVSICRSLLPINDSRVKFKRRLR